MADEVHRLEALFDASGTQQLAYHTILGQVAKHRLAWHSKEGKPIDDVPVPRWWHTFVADTVRAGLIQGVAFYKAYTRRGQVVCEVARATHVQPKWDDRKKAFVPSKPGWKMLVFESPLHEHHALKSASVRLRSACLRARAATLRLQSLQANWTARDSTNSVPAVFTTISEALTNQNGSERQWFRNVVNPDVLQTRAVDVDSTFSSLVHKRADTIRQLDAMTSLRRTREPSADDASEGLGKRPAASAAQKLKHREHIVSDGRAYTEARPLLSLPDTKIMMDELSHNVFFSFGVPPQVLGKNINSERLASSNRLTEMAITAFDILVRQTRQVIGEALRELTETPQGSHLAFSIVLGQHELEALMPVLKTDKAVSLIARCYDIPVEFVDKRRVSDMQCEALGADAQPGQTGRPGNKKPRTEQETVAVMRKKARTPQN